MGETENREPTATADRPREEGAQPRLSESFFEMLLNPPSCKTVGVCDGCGRCER